MIVTLSSSEMLQLWRRCAGLEPSNNGCTVVRFDGIDIDTRLREAMRAWYLALLDDGDRQLLGDPVDAGGLVSCEPRSGSLIGAVTADASVRRLCSLRLAGWRREVEVADEDALRHEIRLTCNRFSCPGLTHPAAWRDGSGRIWAVPAAEVVTARAYIDSGPESYRLDERALSTIPRSFTII